MVNLNTEWGREYFTYNWRVIIWDMTSENTGTHRHCLRKKANDTKKFHNYIICYMTSCEWWRLNGRSTPPPLITHHIINCGKNYEIFYVSSIVLVYVSP